MNAPDPLKQLIDRRLWPVALLLVAAIVAAPMLLKKKDDGGARDLVPTALSAGPTGQNPNDAVVEVADAGKADKVRAVLGDRKDPFRPAQVNRIPTPDPTPNDTSSTALGANAGSGATTTSGGGGGGGASAPSSGSTGSDTTTITEPTATPAPKVYYEMHSLLVKIGDVEGTLSPKNPKRLTSLAGGHTPVLLYLGLLKDEKTAVFLVDAGVQVTGDGKCTPSGKDCQTLLLKPGETEFLTRGDKTWELDLLKVISDQTTDATAAAASRSAVAKDATKKVAHHADRVSGYAYDANTGFLSRVAPKAKVASSHHPTIAKTVALTTTG